MWGLMQKPTTCEVLSQNKTRPSVESKTWKKRTSAGSHTTVKCRARRVHEAPAGFAFELPEVKRVEVILRPLGPRPGVVLWGHLKSVGDATGPP